MAFGWTGAGVNRAEYIRNVAIAFDQLCNAIMCGKPGETVSSRVGAAALAGKTWAISCQFVINAIFLIFTGKWNHCYNAIEWDEQTSVTTFR